MLPAVLRGCGGWFSHVKRKAYSQSGFENRVLRRGEVTGDLKEFRIEELRRLYSSTNIKSRRRDWASHVTHMAHEVA
jgi:hypothetical protein